MLENARKIAASGMTELVIRVPVIPTFNETPEEIAISIAAEMIEHRARLAGQRH